MTNFSVFNRECVECFDATNQINKVLLCLSSHHSPNIIIGAIGLNPGIFDESPGVSAAAGGCHGSSKGNGSRGWMNPGAACRRGCGMTAYGSSCPPEPVMTPCPGRSSVAVRLDPSG